MHKLQIQSPPPWRQVFGLTFLLAACPPQGPQVELKQDVKPGATPAAPTVEGAKAFLDQTEGELRRLWSFHERIKFVEMTYVNHDTEVLAAQAEEQTMEFVGRKAKEARRFDGLKLPEDLARKLHLLKLSQTLPAPPNPEQRAELAQAATFMESVYAKGQYCQKKTGKCYKLDEISRVMMTSRDYDELLDLWQGWHSISKQMRDRYARYVELANMGAKDLGFADLGSLWRSNYDMSPEEFDQEVGRLWGQVEPLYREMHCYVRQKLNAKYGARVALDKPIPAHLLGNMWAQEWGNIYSLVSPFKEGKGPKDLDIKARLLAKKTDAKGLVKYGENFFTSIGLDPLPKTFWERSMFVRPKDREVMCHASAWDISFDGDLRLKMCIEINDDDFQTVHHELGHNYYYHYYKHLPVLFQSGAHDGFHEAIGDTIALSITPAYLNRIGLGDAPTPTKDNPNAEVAILLRRAMDAVAFLPFGMLIDQWRWKVFSGQVSPKDYNKAWWELRTRYQGVAPGVQRTEEDFDPGAKYHIPANVPYMRYFLARILQYQFHKALCETAGHKGPLHQCSIYGNRAAGDRLKALLSMGTSKQWPSAMQAIAGTQQMDAGALLDYYAPLRTWLAEQNKGQKCGW